MPKKANLEDLAELRNRPGKMSCISPRQFILQRYSSSPLFK